MMSFRDVKTALTDLLGNNAEGRFRVIGFQKQTKGAEEMSGNNRMVQIYYSEGAFPKSGRMRGSHTHDIVLEIDISASAHAEADMAVLDSTTATPQQKAAALLAIRTAAEIADRSIDETIDAVYSIIMDARNEKLGLPVGEISSRWIDRIQKDSTIERGELVVKTANIRYTCRVQEYVQGDIGNEPDTVIFNSGVPVGDTLGAGVLVENDNT
ncbi:MAG: hypothetical protein EHM48_00005 [Planctomycetaceae bacterium]|nr:MAG: hypothetical protein EHM48_00005 [Planctomycetaceae bacterium]